MRGTSGYPMGRKKRGGHERDRPFQKRGTAGLEHTRNNPGFIRMQREDFIGRRAFHVRDKRVFYGKAKRVFYGKNGRIFMRRTGRYS
jgi:hypothetical protein